MKAKKFVLFTALLLVVAILLAFFQVSETVGKEIPVLVYTNGEPADQTKIRISGEINRKLLGDGMTYVGKFAIESYEPSCRDGVQAKITWYAEPHHQLINFFYAGDFSAMDVTKIIIDEEMTQIAVEFLDGTVVATSEALYLEMKGK